MSTADSNTPNLYFRNVIPTDLPIIHSLESKAYPSDEAASRSKMQYRQHHAATFFRCAVLLPAEENATLSASVPPTRSASASSNVNDDTISRKHNSLDGKGQIIAFITATRCQIFSEKSMSIHDSTGPVLALHSVVVSDEYRHRGVGAALLKNYLSYLSKLDLKHGIHKLILITKEDNLTFYVKEGGFHVMRQSSVVHGKGVWFECERHLEDNGTKKGERKSECWIVDSFALTGTGGGTGGGIGIGVGGRKGTGNPAAVVLVPAVLGPSVVTDNVADCVGGGSGSTPTGPTGDAFFAPKPERKISISSNEGVFLQDPDHEATISWMKTVAREFNLSETVFIWEHAPQTAKYPDQITDDNESSQNSPPQVLHKHFHNTSIDPDESSPHYTVRFYTRDGTSVDLCGHATLAASAVVFKILSKQGIHLSDMSVDFHAKNGVILNSKPSLAASSTSCSSSVPSRSSSGGVVGAKGRAGSDLSSMKIIMCFPWKDLVPFEQESKERERTMTMLRDAFFSEQEGDKDRQGLSEEDVLYIGVDEGGDDLLVELTSAAFFRIPKRMSEINFGSMREFDGYTRGVILCCGVDDFSRRRQEEQSLSHPSANIKGGKKGGGGGGVTADFMSRFFGPKVGIEEDPVTGSAHCTLGPYFATKLGRKTVVGKQKSQRGGIVECTPRLADTLGILSDEKRTVSIAGTAVMVMNGMLYI